MSNKLITAAAAPAVTLADAKLSLRIDGTDMDAIIPAWVAGVTAHAEHCTNRAIINQTWKLTLDSFPTAIELPTSPVASITSIKYYDTSNVQQTLSALDYFLDNSSDYGLHYVVPVAGTIWPDTYDRINCVEVTYVAGYGASDTYTPAGIKLYLLAKLVEQFDPAVRMEKDTVQASYIDSLLDRYRVYG